MKLAPKFNALRTTEIAHQQEHALHTLATEIDKVLSSYGMSNINYKQAKEDLLNLRYKGEQKSFVVLLLMEALVELTNLRDGLYKAKQKAQEARTRRFSTTHMADLLFAAGVSHG